MGKYIALLNYLSVLIAVSESYRLMGCYKENSIQAPLLYPYDDVKVFKGTLTPAICVNYCKTKGFTYAGLQAGQKCFCSKFRPSYMKLANELSECDSKCDGDKSQTCGGNLRLSVYDIEDKGINHVQGHYEGCFADDGASRRALRGKVFASNNIMSPELCVGYCFVHGYKFAGVQSKEKCFCGESIQGEMAPDCTLQCTGDSRLRCGNAGKSDIYRTSINDEYTPEFVGCFIDSNTRLLPSYYILLPETDSPRRCLSICSLLGFKFAGVQVGIECFCGNKRPDSKKETNENECLTQCTNGKDTACGGIWRIAVYTSSTCSGNACCRA